MQYIPRSLMSILALAMLIGLNTVSAQAQKIYVDPGKEVVGPADGTQEHPYPTLASAVVAAPDGYTLVLKGCKYDDTFTLIYPETGLLPLIIKKKKNLKIETQYGAATIGRPLGTQRLWQLTGETDLERGVSTPSQTATRFGVRGADLGSSFEYDDGRNGNRIYFMFGDTWPSFDPNGTDVLQIRPSNSDSIAWIPANTDPEQPVQLNFLTAGDRKYLPPTVSKPDGSFISLGTCEVPLSGFSANGQMYGFFSTGNYEESSGGCKMGRSVLAKLNDITSVRMFNYLYDASCLPEICGDAFNDKGKFINIAPVVVKDDGFHELLQQMGMGEGVLLWGSGRFHQSYMYLAFLPLNEIENPAAWRYAVTDGQGHLARWSERESDATPLFDLTGIAELSATAVPYQDAQGNRKVKWLMLYNYGDPTLGINYRVADNPWGPWDGPFVLFDPYLDRGFCHFMHADVNNSCDSLGDDLPLPGGPGRSGYWYGPYVISRFTKSDATTATIYWTMSTWNPYQVMLMKSTLRLSDWRRVDHPQLLR